MDWQRLYVSLRERLLGGATLGEIVPGVTVRGEDVGRWLERQCRPQVWEAPIATGAIEGACRHLIGDRLDVTGARWGLSGAEAVLKLRAVKDNDDLDTYLDFHLAREHERLYPTPDQHDYQLTA